MKTYIPAIGLIASLAFGCAISVAQQPTPASRPLTPKPPLEPRAATAEGTSDDDVAAATQAALTAQETASEAQNEALAKVDEKLDRIYARGGHASTSSRSLIIPKDAADAKSVSENEEDMSVMARILEKAANGKGEKGERHVGALVWGYSGSGGLSKNLFIDGYGALFFLNVNYPLLPPTAKEKTAEPKPEADTEWERTQKELYHPQETSSDFSYKFELFDSTGPFSVAGPVEEYDEDKVTDLKENLCAALKNASHIRRLKGDDTVTVVVTGRTPNSAPKVAARRLQNNNSYSSSSATVWAGTSRAGSPAPAARLIIRARKSDIESFQKDKLSADDFRKKASIFVY